METAKIGRSAMLLGAGRSKKDDIIDLTAGIIMHCNLGDEVDTKTPLATFYTNKIELIQSASELFTQAFTINDSASTSDLNFPLIYEEVE